MIFDNPYSNTTAYYLLEASSDSGGFMCLLLHYVPCWHVPLFRLWTWDCKKCCTPTFSVILGRSSNEMYRLGYFCAMFTSGIRGLLFIFCILHLKNNSYIYLPDLSCIFWPPLSVQKCRILAIQDHWLYKNSLRAETVIQWVWLVTVLTWLLGVAFWNRVKYVSHLLKWHFNNRLHIRVRWEIKMTSLRAISTIASKRLFIVQFLLLHKDQRINGRKIRTHY